MTPRQIEVLMLTGYALGLVLGIAGVLVVLATMEPAP